MGALSDDRRSPGRSVEACWLAVHLPALPIEAFAASLVPEQAHRPLALLDKATLCAVDTRAWEAGVRPGQRRATALALEPALLLGRADAVREQEALRAVAYAALQFTPSVTELPPHTVLLEVASTRRLFGGLARLAQRLRESLTPLGHCTRWACAPTALGAALLARWDGWADHEEVDLALNSRSSTDQSPDRLSDQIADQAAGPRTGLRMLSLQELRTALAQVPLALLCDSPTELETLQGMGLRTVGDLKGLPRPGLARRTSPDLLSRWDRAWGERPDLHQWVTLPPAFQARLELHARADSTEQVLHGAHRLLTSLVHWVTARQARVLRFTLEMAHEARHRGGDGAASRSALTLALAQPSADLAHLHALLRERLAQFVLPAPTLELHLRCDELAHLPPPEGELFPTRARAQEGLSRLIEHLQARLGPQRVHGLRALDDHRPEQGVDRSTAQPLPLAAVPAFSSSSKGPGAQASSVSASPSPHLTRPAWLLPEPRPLPEHRGRPVLDGQPLRLLCGPERIETGWWDGPAAARDYFVAATPAGVLVWIFRTRLPSPEEAAGWALQGWFA